MPLPRNHHAVAACVLERVATGASLEKALRPLLEALAQQDTPLLGAVLLYDPDTGAVNRCIASHSPVSYEEKIDASEDDGPSAVAPGGEDRSPGALLESLQDLERLERGRPVRLRGVQPNLGWDDWPPASGLGPDSGLIAPIAGPQGVKLGTLACFWEGEAVLDADEQQLIDETARLAGIAIERNRLDTVFRQRQTLFKALGSTMPGALFQFVRRPDGTAYTWCVRPKARALRRASPRDFEEDATALQDLVHPSDWARFEASMNRSAKHLDPWQWEGRLIAPSNDEVRWIRAAGHPTRQPDGSVHWSGLLVDITEQKENEIGSAILKASTPEAVAEAMLDRVGDLVPFHSASVTEHDPDAGEVVLVARTPERGVPETLPPPSLLSARPGAENILAGDPFYLQDLGAVNNRSASQEALFEWGVRSYLVVPAVVDDEVIGSLNITRATPRAFSENDLSILKEIVDLMALALQQARYREALIAAKEEAEEMSRLKSAFLANMSHEIRTPLTSILGFAELLTDMVGDKSRDLLQMIRQSARRLQETLTAVLELAELESSTKNLRREAIDAGLAVKDVLLLLTPQARAKGLSLQLDVPDRPVEVLADRTALNRILTHITTNAVKFTEEGYVTLRLVPEGATARIEIADTGIGIDPAFVPHLFDEFKQESEGMARNYEGAGLGLSITKRLVELMDGEIEVESEKGTGSTFTVRLPTPAKSREAPRGTSEA